MDSTAIVETLKLSAPVGSVEAVPAGDGMPTTYVDREHVVDVCRELRDRPELAFAIAMDMTAVDYMPREPRYEVVYHLVSIANTQRLRVKVQVPNGGSVPSSRRSMVSTWPSPKARRLGWSESPVAASRRWRA